MEKKELHAYVNAELYQWLREYATQYIEQGYKNWLGKAIEDAILSLMNSRASRTVHKTQKSVKKLESKHIKSRLKCIWSRLEGRIAISVKELVSIICECAGSDYRTIAKYLNILQVHGIRFHQKNVCIVYVQEYSDAPLKQITLDQKKVREIISKCIR